MDTGDRAARVAMVAAVAKKVMLIGLDSPSRPEEVFRNGREETREEVR